MRRKVTGATSSSGLGYRLVDDRAVVARISLGLCLLATWVAVVGVITDVVHLTRGPPARLPFREGPLP